MAKYIKANRKVASYLNLESERNTVKDGNYLLWQGDMLAFGPLINLPETLEKIGGIALQPHEAREEQDGTTIRPLPIATDPRFVIEQEDEAKTTESVTETTESVTETTENVTEEADTAADGATAEAEKEEKEV